MRKKFLLFLFVLIAGAVAISCNKSKALPVYSPSPTYVFTAGSLKHTKDTVNVGDTISLTATGTVYDTTKTISAFLTSTYSTGSNTYGSAASPIKVNRIIGSAASNGLWSWTATILLPGATSVPHKTALTITSTFVYQLSLSSQLPASLTVTDAGTPGAKAKTVYVK
jgi:hypothetical protein